jgi:hypothetical protein
MSNVWDVDLTNSAVHYVEGIVRGASETPPVEVAKAATDADAAAVRTAVRNLYDALEDLGLVVEP